MLTSIAAFSRDPTESLPARLAGFSGFLHANGFGIGGGDAARIVATAARIGILDRDVLRWSLKAMLCGHPGEWHRFDDLFDAYFLPPNKRVFVEGERGASRIASMGSSKEARDDDVDGSRREEPHTEATRYGASRETRLATTDFAELARADEAQELDVLIRRFARRLKRLELRREARALRGRRLDLPATIRRSVERGGMPMSLRWKDRRRIRPRLVLLLDVSRSMALYSFFYLRLARALTGELTDVHSYIFHTRLTGVSEALRDPDAWRAQEKMHLLAEGWGGGTRIGECLREFNRMHAPRRVHSRTAVIVMSDGYDTGEPAGLAAALEELRRRARRIVWINPLAARPGWAPESRGMRAALPHLDRLVSGPDLASLARVLPDILEGLR